MSFEVGHDLDFPDFEGPESEKALSDMLEFFLDESNKIVPLEEGTLMRSGVVDVEGKRGTVSYDTVYACYQHEKTDMSHDEGREAKYLERAIKRNYKNALKHLEGELGDLF